MTSIRVLLTLIVASSAFAQTPAVNLPAVVLAHGGAAVNALQSIQITGNASSRGVSQPIVISAAVDGRIRLDYGSPVQRSIITTDQGRVETRGNQIFPKPPHVGLFSVLDMLSVLGIRRLLEPNVSVTTIGTGTVAGHPTVRIKEHYHQNDSSNVAVGRPSTQMQILIGVTYRM